MPESMKPGNDRYYYIDKGGKTYDDYIKFNERTDCKKNAYYHLDKPGDKNFYAVWGQNRIRVTYHVKSGSSNNYTKWKSETMWAGQKFNMPQPPASTLLFFTGNWRDVTTPQTTNQTTLLPYKANRSTRLHATSIMYAQYTVTRVKETTSFDGSQTIKVTKYRNGDFFGEVIYHDTKELFSCMITAHIKGWIDNPEKKEYGLDKHAVDLVKGAKAYFDAFSKAGGYPPISVGSDEYYLCVYRILNYITSEEEKQPTRGELILKNLKQNVDALLLLDFLSKIRLPNLKKSSVAIEGVGKGKLTGSLDKLTQAERTMIDDLLNQGKNVEIIPRSNVQGVKTPDFKINGVPTELKSLSGTSLNTPVTKIQKGFKQGAKTVIIDGRASGLTVEQANTVISRIKGVYNNNIPGKIEIWTNGGTVFGGG